MAPADLMGAAPQGGTSAQLGVSCGCLASVANGLQHKQKLKQDDGGALRLVVRRPAHHAQSTAHLLGRDPLKGPCPGCGLSSPDQHPEGLPEGAVGIHGIPGSSQGSRHQELLTGPVQRHTKVVHQSRDAQGRWSWPRCSGETGTETGPTPSKKPGKGSFTGLPMGCFLKIQMPPAPTPPLLRGLNKLPVECDLQGAFS